MVFAPGWNPGEQTDSFESPIFDTACVTLGSDPLLSKFANQIVFLAPGHLLDLSFISEGTGSYTHHILINDNPVTWMNIVNTYATADVPVVIQQYAIPGLAYKFSASFTGGIKSNVFIRFGT